MIAMFGRHILCKIMALTVCLTFVWQSFGPIDEVCAQSAAGRALSSEIKVPARFGEIVDSFKGNLGKTIIHIRDAHCDYSSQNSISGMIGHLRDNYGIKLIALEGGSGDYDLSVFTDIKELSLREKVADYFVKQGEVNGAEFFAINNPSKVTLYGIEEPALYIENLNIYRDSLKFKDKALALLKSMALDVSKKKDRIYPAGFRELDTKMRLFKEDKIGFEEYAAAIADYAKKNNTDMSKYPNIIRFYEAVDSENGVNMKNAERERNVLIDLLNKKLSKKYLEELVAKTVAFNDDEISAQEYYPYLLAKAKLCGIETDKMPNLTKYTHTANKINNVDKKALEREFKALEEDMCSSFPKTDEQKALCVLDKKIFILDRLFSVGLVKDNWDYYIAHRSEFDLNRPGLKKSLSALTVPAWTQELDSYRLKMEKFYSLSLKRDDVFVNKITDKFKKEKNIILVTGGFHQDNLKKLFQDKGYSYIEILPKIEKQDGENPYFSLLSGGMDPIARAISAKQSSLQVASYLSTELRLQDCEAFAGAVKIIKELLEKGTAEFGNLHFYLSTNADNAIAVLDHRYVQVSGEAGKPIAPSVTPIPAAPAAQPHIAEVSIGYKAKVIAEGLNIKIEVGTPELLLAIMSDKEVAEGLANLGLNIIGLADSIATKGSGHIDLGGYVLESGYSGRQVYRLHLSEKADPGMLVHEVAHLVWRNMPKVNQERFIKLADEKKGFARDFRGRNVEGELLREEQFADIVGWMVMGEIDNRIDVPKNIRAFLALQVMANPVLHAVRKAGESYVSRALIGQTAPAPTVPEVPAKPAAPTPSTAPPAPRAVELREAVIIKITGGAGDYKYFNPAVLPNGTLLARRVSADAPTDKPHRSDIVRLIPIDGKIGGTEFKAGGIVMEDAEDPRIMRLGDRLAMTFIRPYNEGSNWNSHLVFLNEDGTLSGDGRTYQLGRPGVDSKNTYLIELANGKVAMIDRANLPDVPASIQAYLFNNLEEALNPSSVYWQEHSIESATILKPDIANGTSHIGFNTMVLLVEEGPRREIIVFIHSAKFISDDNKEYVTAGVRLDAETLKPLGEPIELPGISSDHLQGDVKNVLYETGTSVQGDKVTSYAGVADTKIARIETPVSELMKWLHRTPPGKPATAINENLPGAMGGKPVAGQAPGEADEIMRPPMGEGMDPRTLARQFLAGAITMAEAEKALEGMRTEGLPQMTRAAFDRAVEEIRGETAAGAGAVALSTQTQQDAGLIGAGHTQKVIKILTQRLPDITEEDVDMLAVAGEGGLAPQPEHVTPPATAPQAPTIVGKGPVHAESMQVKGKYYSAQSMKNGRPVVIKTAEEALKFGQGLKNARKYEVKIDTEWKTFNVVVENGVGLTGDEIGSLIMQALARTKAYGLTRLPETIVIALLDKSSHMFEDHISNGFIGINRSINTIKDKDIRKIMLKVGVCHELCHEITGEGVEMEGVQLTRDAQYALELIKEKKNAPAQFISVLSDILEGGLDNDFLSKINELKAPVGPTTEAAMQILPPTTETRLRLIADRLGVPFDRMDAWMKTNPEKAKIIQERLKEIADMDEEFKIIFKGIIAQNVAIDRKDKRFSGVYNETEEIVRRLLRAAGFDPSNYNLYIVDVPEESAFVVKYCNNIFVNKGLIKFIVENGGSKDALAFVLAHEIRHTFQWIDDCIDGKHVERDKNALLMMHHSDEHDADYSLELIDKAGYSVRYAGFFFRKFMEKYKKDRPSISMGFLSHPPSDERLRRIDNDVMRFFWLHYFNEPEQFSDASKKQLNNNTAIRSFQKDILASKTKDDFLAYLKTAGTKEEFMLAFMMAFDRRTAYKIEWSDAEIIELYEMFFKKFNISDSDEKDFYRSILDSIRLESSKFGHNSYKAPSDWHDVYRPLLEEVKNRLRFDSRSLDGLTALLSSELPTPMQIPTAYGKGVYSLDYSGYLNIVIFEGACNRIEQLYTLGSTKDIGRFLELIKVLKKRYLEGYLYDSNLRFNSCGDYFYFNKILIILIKSIKDNFGNDIKVPPEYFDELLSLLDFVDDLKDQEIGQVDTLKAFIELMSGAPYEYQAKLVSWVSKYNKDKTSRFRNNLFTGLSINIDSIKALPGAGKDAKSDIDALFSCRYFSERSISMLISKPAYGGLSTEENLLMVIIDNLKKKYNLSDEKTIELYEHVMSKLRTRSIDPGVESLYYMLFLKIRNLAGIDARAAQNNAIDKNINPQLKQLIYFYKLGGVLSFQRLRAVVFNMGYKIERYGRDATEPLHEEDIKALHAALISNRDEIKGRYPEKEQSDRDLRWNKYILPFAAAIFLDRNAVNPYQFNYYNSDSRFGRFMGEFGEKVGAEYIASAGGFMQIGQDPEYTRTKGGQGKGVNRVFLRGENASDFIKIFDYIIDSGDSYEKLLDDIIKIPATSYRNYALYILFVYKFLHQECAVEIDSSKAFDLEYIQNIIANLSEANKAKAIERLRAIASLTVRDTDMKEINTKNATIFRIFKLYADKTKREQALTEHAAEEKTYYPREYTELGGALSQLDLFIGLLAEDHILDAIRSKEKTSENKINIICTYFPRKSGTRDRFLAALIDENRDTVDSATAEKVAALLSSKDLEKKYSIFALEKKRVEAPKEFKNIDTELKWILHYLPDFSPDRDDILLQVIDEKAKRPEDVKKFRAHLLNAPENIREKARSDVTFGTSIIDDMIRNMNARQKMEFLIWALGISDIKPDSIKLFEHAYNVSLNGIKDKFIGKREGYYKNIGDSALEDFLKKIFLEEGGAFFGNGILNDVKVTDEFLNTLFNTIMPDQQTGVLKTIYDTVFKKSDINRKYIIISAMLKNFSKESRSAQGINKARSIRVFLESMGLIGVKLGQFLSTYKDMPEDIKEELKLLKDRAALLSKDVVFDAISKIYGGFDQSPINEIMECLGSASIKVVYRARLKDGREIVVKMKRPDVDKKVEEDLAFLRSILSDESVQKAFRDNNIQIPQQLSDRIAEMIKEEMNLRGEVENQARLNAGINAKQIFRRRLVSRIFNYFLSKIFNIPQATYSFNVPATYDVQNNTLIIEGFVKGGRIAQNNIDAKTAVARELMRQMFVDGFYHADPHTGNMFLGIDGNTIYFIDIGSASSISFKNKYILYRLMKAINSGNGNKIAGVIRMMAGKKIGNLDQKASDIASSKDDIIKKILVVFKFLEDSNITIDKQLISVFRCFGQGESLFRDALKVLSAPPAAQPPQAPAAPAALSAEAKPPSAQQGQMKPIGIRHHPLDEDAQFVLKGEAKIREYRDLPRNTVHDGIKFVYDDLGDRIGGLILDANKDPIAVINVNMSRAVQEEAEFHEENEILFMKQGLSQHEAHVIASAKYIEKFSRNGTELTPYHRYLISEGNLTMEELAAIVRETEGVRAKWHHHVLKNKAKIADENLNLIKKYEDMLRRTAKEKLHAAIVSLGLTDKAEAYLLNADKPNSVGLARFLTPGDISVLEGAKNTGAIFEKAVAIVRTMGEERVATSKKITAKEPVASQKGPGIFGRVFGKVQWAGNAQDPMENYSNAFRYREDHGQLPTYPDFRLLAYHGTQLGLAIAALLNDGALDNSAYWKATGYKPISEAARNEFLDKERALMAGEQKVKDMANPSNRGLDVTSIPNYNRIDRAFVYEFDLTGLMDTRDSGKDEVYTDEKALGTDRLQVYKIVPFTYLTRECKERFLKDIFTYSNRKFSYQEKMNMSRSLGLLKVRAPDIALINEIEVSAGTKPGLPSAPQGERVKSALDARPFTPERLVDALADLREIRRLYGNNRSIWDHTLRVMKQFERYFPEGSRLPAGIDRMIFRLLLALHDIGKPLGDREEQYENTLKVIIAIEGELPVSKGGIGLIKALIKDDLLGSGIRGRDAAGTITPKIAAGRIRSTAKSLGMDAGEFFNILTVYYQMDAVSYTTIANPESHRIDASGGILILDDLFVPNFNGDGFEVANDRLKFSPRTAERFNNIERLVRAAPAAPASPSGTGLSGARKNILLDTDEILAPREKMWLLDKAKELISLEGAAAFPVVKDVNGVSVTYRLIEYDADGEIDRLFKKRGIEGSYTLAPPDLPERSESYVFIEKGLPDRADALRHEELELKWRAKLKGDEDKDKLPPGFGEERSAHILAWAEQIGENGWDNYEQSPFMRAQAEMLKTRLNRLTKLICEKRRPHKELVEIFLPLYSDKIEKFEESFMKYVMALDSAYAERIEKVVRDLVEAEGDEVIRAALKKLTDELPAAYDSRTSARLFAAVDSMTEPEAMKRFADRIGSAARDAESARGMLNDNLIGVLINGVLLGDNPALVDVFVNELRQVHSMELDIGAALQCVANSDRQDIGPRLLAYQGMAERVRQHPDFINDLKIALNEARDECVRAHIIGDVVIAMDALSFGIVAPYVFSRNKAEVLAALKALKTLGNPLGVRYAGGLLDSVDPEIKAAAEDTFYHLMDMVIETRLGPASEAPGQQRGPARQAAPAAPAAAPQTSTKGQIVGVVSHGNVHTLNIETSEWGRATESRLVSLDPIKLGADNKNPIRDAGEVAREATPINTGDNIHIGPETEGVVPIGFACGPCIALIIHNTRTKETYAAHSFGDLIGNLERVIEDAKERFGGGDAIEVIVAGAGVHKSSRRDALSVDHKDEVENIIRVRGQVIEALAGFKNVKQIFPENLGIGVILDFDITNSILYPRFLLDESAQQTSVYDYLDGLKGESPATIATAAPAAPAVAPQAASPTAKVSYKDRKATILNAAQKIKDILASIFRNLFDGKPIRIYVLGATPTDDKEEPLMELEHSSDVINERNAANRAINERTGIGTGNIDISHTIGIVPAKEKITKDILILSAGIPKERMYCAISASVLEELEKDKSLTDALEKSVTDFLKEKTMLTVMEDYVEMQNAEKKVYLTPYLEATVLGLARINILAELEKNNKDKDMESPGVKEAIDTFSKAMGLVSNISEENSKKWLAELLAASKDNPEKFFKDHVFRMPVPEVTEIDFNQLKGNINAMIQAWRSV